MYEKINHTAVLNFTTFAVYAVSLKSTVQVANTVVVCSAFLAINSEYFYTYDWLAFFLQ
jgi:hypothetical protein